MWGRMSSKDVIQRPIVNRPGGAASKTGEGRLTIGRRLATCPTLVLFGSAVFSGAGLPLPDGPGRKTLETACVACHPADVVTQKRWSNQQWRDSVNAMIARGASLKERDKAELLEYLGRHFGKARGLFEDICSSCHSLERVAKRSLNKEEWSTFIKGMISEGNPVTDEEFGVIVDYLAENYGDRGGESNNQ